MFRKPFLQRLAIVFLLMSVLLAGIVAVAAATTDRFYASRIVAWRGAFHDFERFPSRRVPAGPKAFSFAPARRPYQSCSEEWTYGVEPCCDRATYTCWASGRKNTRGP